MTKRFALRTVLTVTTGRLLTESDAKHTGNGIDHLYELLNWMTADNLTTHQLGRAAEECKPWLLRWFPELTVCSVCLDSLDKWISKDRTGGDEGIKMWIAELKLMFPALKGEYDIPQIPADDHERKDPVDELIQMRGSDEGVMFGSTGRGAVMGLKSDY